VSITIEDPSAINTTQTDNAMLPSSDGSDDDDSSQDGFETDYEDDSKSDLFWDDPWDDSQEYYIDKRYTQMVTVRVGRDKAPFKLHRALLSEKSLFFRNALKPGRWREGTRKVVFLAEVGAQEFKMYMHWVYKSRLDYAALGYRENGDDFVTFDDCLANDISGTYSNVSRHMEKTGDWAHRLIVLWVAADFLGDVGLQNTIMEELEGWWFQEEHVFSIHKQSFVFVDRHTPPNSPLRKFCIDWADLSEVFRSRVGSQPEIERFPRWMLSKLLLMKERRERGTLGDDDPREMDMTQRGRYDVC
jgi:hypothetical protein